MIVGNDKEGPHIFEEGLQNINKNSQFELFSESFCGTKTNPCIIACSLAKKIASCINLLSCITSDKEDLGSGSVEAAKGDEDDDDDGGEDDEEEDGYGDPGLVALPPSRLPNSTDCCIS